MATIEIDVIEVREMIEFMRELADELEARIDEVDQVDQDFEHSGDLDMSATEAAIAQVETKNDPSSHRPGSQYYGTFHMGRRAGMDVGFEDRGVTTTSELEGDRQGSLEAHRAYMRRYKLRLKSAIHHAVIWKGGPGTLQLFQSVLDDGKTLPEALTEADTMVSRVSVYVSRFMHAYEHITGSPPTIG